MSKLTTTLVHPYLTISSSLCTSLFSRWEERLDRGRRRPTFGCSYCVQVPSVGHVTSNEREMKVTRYEFTSR